MPVSSEPSVVSLNLQKQHLSGYITARPHGKWGEGGQINGGGGTFTIPISSM